ncbi:MAG: NACHT domain-containing NTPase, partial [Synechococcus sp.]
MVMASALGMVVDASIATTVSFVAEKLGGTLNQEDLKSAFKASVAYSLSQQQENIETSLFLKCEDRHRNELLSAFFTNSEVQGGLEKLLDNEGLPDSDVFCEVLKSIAAEKNFELNEIGLNSWVDLFCQDFFERTVGIRFQIARQRYLKQLCNRLQQVEFIGIAVESREQDQVALLENIFVVPDLRGDSPKTDYVSRERELLELEESEGRQMALIREQQLEVENDTEMGTITSATKILNQGDGSRFVILGDPGSGKTTLLRYFTLKLAEGKPEEIGLDSGDDWLPILVRIRDWVLRLQDCSFLEYLQRYCERSLSVCRLPEEFFEHWLNRGKALILLDGLDEVADDATRQEVVNRIRSFLNLSDYEKNPAIITSRPAGYRRSFFQMDRYPHFELQKFDEPKIELFIDNWYNKRQLDPEEALEGKKSLLEALEQNNRIKLLSSNPLLLTIVAMIHRYQAYLPRKRYELYDKAVNTLLLRWDQGKKLKSPVDREIPESQRLQYLVPDDFRRLMEMLAYWIHDFAETNDREKGTLIERTDLLEQIRKFILDILEERNVILSRHSAEREAERFVEYIRNRTGLMNEQGQECYAFAHKTFQEYLAAQEIFYRQSDDFQEVLDHVQQHLHIAHWREALLLLIAQQVRKNPSKILKTILESESEYEQWLHRCLLFAGSCLAEDIPVTDKALATQILERLVQLEVTDSPLVSQGLRSQVYNCLCSLGETRFQQEALDLLKEQLSDDTRLQLYRVTLGERQEATNKLVECLQDGDSAVRSRASEALGRLGTASDTVILGLVKCLQDRDRTVRYGASEALGRLGT